MRSVSGDVFAARDTAAATACFFGAPDRKAAADKAASAAISSHRPEHRRNDAAALMDHLRRATYALSPMRLADIGYGFDFDAPRS